MDKFLHSRLFRCLVCLVLVCCILINCSPIRAKASLAIAALTAPQVAGLISCIVGTAVGNVILVESLAELAAVGNIVYTPGITENDEVMVGELTSYTNNLNDFWNGDGEDPDPDLNKIDHEMILGTAAALLYDSIVNGRLETEVEEEVEVEIPEGFASYNGYILPSLPDYDSGKYPYAALIYKESGNHVFYAFDKEPYYGSGLMFGRAGVRVQYTWYTDSWKFNGESDFLSFSVGVPTWTNFSLCDQDGTLYLPAVPPITSDYTTTEKKTITIDPIYVGDLPTQIENGDLDEEESKKKILDPLPDHIDITKVIKSPETAVEDLTQWQQQVVDNQKTLEEALEDITGELEDIKDNTDPSDPSTPSDPPMVTPPPLVSGYVPHPLDMRNFFPFCIPFDLYDFFTVLAAEPEAPKFHWEIQDLSGHAYAIDIDLKSWDPVAELFRKFQLLLFITGLAVATRKFIKW